MLAKRRKHNKLDFLYLNLDIDPDEIPGHGDPLPETIVGAIDFQFELREIDTPPACPVGSVYWNGNDFLTTWKGVTLAIGRARSPQVQRFLRGGAYLRLTDSFLPLLDVAKMGPKDRTTTGRLRILGNGKVRIEVWAGMNHAGFDADYRVIHPDVIWPVIEALAKPSRVSLSVPAGRLLSVLERATAQYRNRRKDYNPLFMFRVRENRLFVASLNIDGRQVPYPQETTFIEVRGSRVFGVAADQSIVVPDFRYVLDDVGDDLDVTLGFGEKDRLVTLSIDGLTNVLSNRVRVDTAQ